MESTGVYWKPVFNVLEDAFEVMLVNARHVKNVPGRKTDVKDSEGKLHPSETCPGIKGSHQIQEKTDTVRYLRETAGGKGP